MSQAVNKPPFEARIGRCAVTVNGSAKQSGRESLFAPILNRIAE